MQAALAVDSFERHRLNYGCFLTGVFRNTGDVVIPAGAVRLASMNGDLPGHFASIVNFWPIVPKESLTLSLVWPFPEGHPDRVLLVDYVALDGQVIAPLDTEVDFSLILGTSTLRPAER